MTNYKFGDIVLIPFPFTDQSSTKKRQAVVVSSTAYNLTRIDIVVMAVTSQVRLPTKADEIEIMEWQKAGLLKPSVIKPIFTTIEKALVIRDLGSLETADAEALRNILRTILGW